MSEIKAEVNKTSISGGEVLQATTIPSIMDAGGKVTAGDTAEDKKEIFNIDIWCLIFEKVSSLVVPLGLEQADMAIDGTVLTDMCQRLYAGDGEWTRTGVCTMAPTSSTSIKGIRQGNYPASPPFV
jgi:hypothetical protein